MSSKLTPVGRVSYPNVFDAKAIGDNTEKLFTLDLIFDEGTDLSELEAAIMASANEKWPKGLPKNWQSPLKDGDDKEDAPEYAGKKYISLKAKEDRQPTVVDRDKSIITRESGKMYGGCYARVSYNCYSWEYLGKKGTSVGLKNIQKTADGTPLGGGRTTAEEDFEEYEEESQF